MVTEFQKLFTTLYHRKCFVERVYDGDTITVMLDKGMNDFTKNKSVRLFGIDTPERRGAEKEFGDEIGQVVRDLLLAKWIKVITHRDKTGKYGRLLGTVYYLDHNDEVQNLNEQLLDWGFATPYGDDAWRNRV